MDIVCNQENFMEARLSLHTATIIDYPQCHLSWPVSSLQQQCSCAIDLERLRPRQRQKRLFDLAASDSLHEIGLFFRVHRLHWVWNWVQVWPDLSKEHEKHKVEMDIACNQENFMEARLSPHTATILKAIYLSLCSNSALRPLVWTAWESDSGRVGTLQ